MIHYAGLIALCHSFLVAIKPVFTRVLMIAVVLHEFRILANSDAAPESFIQLVSALSGLLSGLLIFIIVVPIIIYLERIFRRLSLKRVSNKNDRVNLEIGSRVFTCLWGLSIAFVCFYALYDFWKMCILIFFCSVGISLILLNIINLALGRYSVLLTTVFLNFGSVCFYLLLMASFFLYTDANSIEFDMLFVLIMLPRICFEFITRVYLSYIKIKRPLDVPSIVNIFFSPPHRPPGKPQRKMGKLATGSKK